MHEVTDDSGFLAVVVPTTYEGFVDSDWKFDQLLNHFRAQMSRQSLLIWGTGLAGIWKVEVLLRASRRNGFREVSGPIQVIGGCVLLTNYESLTMAAQFEDVRLPEPHQKNLLVEVPDGEYRCRVIQMFDPSNAGAVGPGKPDFVVEFARAGSLPAAWAEIPWFTE
ncbi:MAG: hypothetical protein U0792_06410 [Gemmataceae bacterium]